MPEPEASSGGFRYGPRLPRLKPGGEVYAVGANLRSRNRRLRNWAIGWFAFPWSAQHGVRSDHQKALLKLVR